MLSVESNRLWYGILLLPDGDKRSELNEPAKEIVKELQKANYRLGEDWGLGWKTTDIVQDGSFYLRVAGSLDQLVDEPSGPAIELFKEYRENSSEQTRTWLLKPELRTLLKHWAATNDGARVTRSRGGDAAAFRHYAFAEALPQDLGIRLVQSGPGTLWTDLQGTAGLDDALRARLLKQPPQAK